MAKKGMRRLFTASATCALIIALASCSAAKNNVGLIPDGDYASVTDKASGKKYTVSYKDIWDELKWNSSDVLKDQIANVVLNNYVKKIDIAVKNDKLTSEDDKTLFGFSEEKPYSDAAYQKIKKEIEDRLVDYVVYDIYSVTYKQGTYWKDLDALTRSNAILQESKYVDKMYQNYNITIDINTLKNAEYKNYDKKYDTYLDLAKLVPQKYYIDVAKELLTFDKIKEKVIEANEDDEDPEDTNWGKYTESNYVDKFKSDYANGYDIETVVLNFSSSDELNNTLRAFGLKLYNKNLYYIYDSQDSSKYSLIDDGTTKSMKYEDYISYYDDYKTSDLGTVSDKNGIQLCSDVSDSAVLEIFIQIYNYVYGGYKTKLASNYNFGEYKELNDLRKITQRILETYSSDGQTKLTAAIDKLQQNNASEIKYSNDKLTNTYGDSFKTYVYNTLTTSTEDVANCYTTSDQSTSKGSTLAYKISKDYTKNDGEDVDSNLVTYFEWYNKDRSTSDISTYIKEESNTALYDEITDALIYDEISLYSIGTYYDEEVKEAEVKVYNEACEIAYSKDVEDYSKTIKKNKNSNILATIKYDDVTWNVNIYEDSNDEKSTVWTATDKKFGVFNYLETKSGSTAAVNLLYTQMIMDTQEYQDVLDNKDKIEDFETYIESVLLSFSNNGLSSSGYASSIGKYNFLMLYYHTADIKEIVEKQYAVSYAASVLLSDYSSEDMVNFVLKYTKIAQDNYFNLSGKRLLAYMDLDEDGNGDIDFDYTKTITETASAFYGKTYEEVCKTLILKVYDKLSSSTTAHADKAQSIVDEYSSTAKVGYSLNPISSENDWSEFKRVGINLSLVDFAITSSSIDCDFNLKQRLYDYVNGVNSEDSSITYEYFIKQEVPTCYIEPMNDDVVKTTNKTIVQTKDGFNLIMVTEGSTSGSAKFSSTEYSGVLEDLKFVYNDKFVTVENIYNEEDSINYNQVLFYLLDVANNSESAMCPVPLENALKGFIQPIVTKLETNETSTILSLTYMNNKSGSTGLYDAVQFANTTYAGEDGRFAKLIVIAQQTADEYNSIYGDTTGTSDLYTYVDDQGNTVTWWSGLVGLVKKGA